MVKKIKYSKPKMEFDNVTEIYQPQLPENKKCSCSCGCEKEKKEASQGHPCGEKLTKVYFCPNCKSTDVCYYFSLKNLFGIIPMMQCKKCNFRAPGFPQWVVGQKALNKANSKLNNKKKKRKK